MSHLPWNTAPRPSPHEAARERPPRDTLFWIALAAVIVAAAGLMFFRLGHWPWDHDEVPSLIELGVADDRLAGEVLSSQVDRLPRLVPVWYTLQGLVLQVLPHDELGARVLSALCGAATVVAAFVLGWRWRGPVFAAALALLLGLNQCFVWLSQQNRFYSMAMLFLVLCFGAISWRTSRRVAAGLVCAALALLAVLSHNLLVVVLGIAAIAAVLVWVLERVPGLPLGGSLSKALLLRSLIAATVGFGTYLIYLRPIMTGWISGGTGGTNELVSFAAQLGVPTIALAGLGLGLVWARREVTPGLLWWTGMLIGGLMFVGLSPWLLGNWNPRYALFFMPPFWVLGAVGVEQIAASLSTRGGRVVWFAAVAMLLLPKLASHYLDGSRHDFRAAAAAVQALDVPAEVVYCNWPMTLDYYLRRPNSPQVRPWPPNDGLPRQEFVLVFASNAYASPIELPSRQLEVAAQIVRRRFDEQSHMIRLYRVGPK